MDDKLRLTPGSPNTIDAVTGSTATRDDDVSVVTVDDQAVFRATARDVIDATAGFASAGEFASSEEAVAAIAELAPELVLVDVRMPGTDGVETARRIRSAGTSTVVILISVEDRASLPEDVATSGAAALVSKQDFGPKLLRRLWRVHGGAEDAAQ